LTQLSKRKKIILLSPPPGIAGSEDGREVWPALGGTMQMNRGLIHAIGLAVAGLVAGADMAQAQVTDADVGVNPTFEQTGATR
jgi:hypothetical protein